MKSPEGNRSGLAASLGAMSDSNMSLMLRVTSDRLLPVQGRQGRKERGEREGGKKVRENKGPVGGSMSGRTH